MWGVTLYLTAFTEPLPGVTSYFTAISFHTWLFFCSDRGKQAVDNQTERKLTKLLSGILYRRRKAQWTQFIPLCWQLSKPHSTSFIITAFNAKIKTKAPTHGSDALEPHKHPVGKHILLLTQTAAECTHVQDHLLEALMEISRVRRAFFDWVFGETVSVVDISLKSTLN